MTTSLPPGLPPPPRPDASTPRRRNRAELVLITTIVVGLVASTLVASSDRDERARASEGPDESPARVLTAICEETDRLLDLAESMPVADGDPVETLEALTPTELDAPFSYAGQRRVPDAETIGEERGPVWLSELRRDGFQRGLIRAWRLPGGAIAQAQVYEFETRAGALAFQRFALMDQSCPYSTDVFTVEDVHGSVGLQIRWADGTESEQVSFVRGSRRYLANVRGPVVPERRLVLTLTERVNSTAR